MPHLHVDEVLNHQYAQIKRWARLALHDNNNIINNIMLALHQLRDEDGDLDEEVRDLCIKIIEDNVKKINQPFEAIVKYEGGDAEIIKIIDEIRIIRDNALIKAEKNNTKLTLVNKNVQDELLKINRDAFIFVFQELIDNGIQFAPRGTEIIIENEIINDTLRVSVQNTLDGNNMAHNIDLVAFYSTKQKGIGLGIRKVKDIIQATGGSFQWNVDTHKWLVTITIPLYQS